MRIKRNPFLLRKETSAMSAEYAVGFGNENISTGHFVSRDYFQLRAHQLEQVSKFTSVRARYVVVQNEEADFQVRVIRKRPGVPQSYFLPCGREVTSLRGNNHRGFSRRRPTQNLNTSPAEGCAV